MQVIPSQGERTLPALPGARRPHEADDTFLAGSRRHNAAEGPAYELISSHLGPGMAKECEVVWRITDRGRPCLIYLHSWASGPQTVTTLDSARPAHAMVRHFEVKTTDSLEKIEEELQSLLKPLDAPLPA